MWLRITFDQGSWVRFAAIPRVLNFGCGPDSCGSPRVDPPAERPYLTPPPEVADPVRSDSARRAPAPIGAAPLSVDWFYCRAGAAREWPASFFRFLAEGL